MGGAARAIVYVLIQMKYKQIIIDSVDKSYDKTELTKLIKEYTELKLKSIILNQKISSYEH